MSSADLSGYYLKETAYAQGEYPINLKPLSLYLFGYEGDVVIECHAAGATYTPYPDGDGPVFRGWTPMSGKVKLVVGAGGALVKAGPVNKEV